MPRFDAHAEILDFMETLFKRYFWVIQWVAAALSALLIGAGVSRFVLAKVAHFGVAIPDEGMATPGGTKPAERLPLESISEVGFPAPPEPEFIAPCANVTCEEGLVCNPDTGVCELPEGAVPDDGTGPCIDTDLALNLAGTMVSQEAEWSVAVLHNPATKKTEFARVGDTLLSQAEVTSISRSRVMLMRNGRAECLRPESVRKAAASRPKPPTPAARPTRPATTRPADPKNLDEIAQTAIKRTGVNDYSIDKNALDSVLSNPNALQDQAPSVAPYYKDGKAAGFRLNGVRSGSVFSSLGIRNGDVIQSVNGQLIDSPQRAMELYQRLRQTGSIELIVERGGRPTTLNYNVQ